MAGSSFSLLALCKRDRRSHSSRSFLPPFLGSEKIQNDHHKKRELCSSSANMQGRRKRKKKTLSSDRGMRLLSQFWIAQFPIAIGDQPPARPRNADRPLLGIGCRSTDAGTRAKADRIGRCQSSDGLHRHRKLGDIGFGVGSRWPPLCQPPSLKRCPLPHLPCCPSRPYSCWPKPAVPPTSRSSQVLSRSAR